MNGTSPHTPALGILKYERKVLMSIVASELRALQIEIKRLMRR
jgi:hypothetical protein